MFVIDLHYIVPLEKLDEHMGDHVKFLRKYYKQNTFVASGRKVPRTGGIILAQAESRDRIEAILAEDPFIRHQLATVTITEFQTSQMHPGFKALMELLSAG
jgi:uncharacterized protein YciI